MCARFLIVRLRQDAVPKRSRPRNCVQRKLRHDFLVSHRDCTVHVEKHKLGTRRQDVQAAARKGVVLREECDNVVVAGRRRHALRHFDRPKLACNVTPCHTCHAADIRLSVLFTAVHTRVRNHDHDVDFAVRKASSKRAHPPSPCGASR